MKQSYLIFLTLCIPTLLLAQNYHQVYGKIIDKDNKEPLAYVHIGMPTQGIGTISNAEGIFNFSFPDYFQKEPIIVSHIGYEEYQLQATELSRDSLTIRLVPISQDIAEVEVLGTAESAHAYITKAYEHFEENYPTDHFQLSGFYRELIINAETEQYTRLMEAAFRMQDKGYQTDYEKNRWELMALRKSDDQTDYHDKWIQYLVRNPQYNDMTHVFLRTLRHRIKWKAQLKEWGITFEKPEDLRVNVKDVTYLGNEKLYVIEYDYKHLNAIYYISAEDYGIHRIEIRRYSAISSNPDSIPFKRKVYNKWYGFGGYGYDNYIMQFTKINQKYYLSYLQRIYRFARINNIEPNHDNSASAFSIQTLTVNEILPDKKQFKRIKGRNLVDEEVDLYNHDIEYDPKFWKNYLLLAQNPLEQRIIQDLTSDSSLEEQFKRNGAKEK